MFTTFLPCDWRQEACIATSFESTGFGVQPTIIWGAPTTCAESINLCFFVSLKEIYQDSAEYFKMNLTVCSFFATDMCIGESWNFCPFIEACNRLLFQWYSQNDHASPVLVPKVLFFKANQVSWGWGHLEQPKGLFFKANQVSWGHLEQPEK